MVTSTYVSAGCRRAAHSSDIQLIRTFPFNIYTSTSSSEYVAIMSVAHIADSKGVQGPAKWSAVKNAVQFSAAAKDKNRRNQTDTLPVSTTSTSVSAAFARSLVLFTGKLIDEVC